MWAKVFLALLIKWWALSCLLPLGSESLGLWQIHSFIKTSTQCMAEVQNCKCLELLGKEKKSKTRNIIMPVYNATVCWHMEKCVLFWCLHLENVTLDLKKVQRKAMMIKHMGWNGFHMKNNWAGWNSLFWKRNSLWKEIKNEKRELKDQICSLGN